MRHFLSLFSLLSAALVLVGCAGTSAPLPTLAPTLTATDAPSASPTLVSPTTEPTAEASATPDASATSALSATPTRRVSPTPAPSQTATDVPTTTPLPTLASARTSPTVPAAPSDFTATPLASPTPESDSALMAEGGALAAWRVANAEAQRAVPSMRVFFISGNRSDGWTVGYREPQDGTRQALFQVSPDDSLLRLDVASPLPSEPFDPADVMLDSPALEVLTADFAAPNETLIYTLSVQEGRLVWEVLNANQSTRRLYDALSAELIP